MRTEPRERRYLEDIEVGSSHCCGSVRLSKEGIVEFATRYDPLAIHTDPEAAAESRFGGVIASGYHTLSVVVRTVVESVRQQRAVIAGLGMDNVRWHEPVRPGDTISVETTIVDTERSERNPDAGVLHEEIVATNQSGTTVLSFECFELVERRPATRESRVACDGWNNTDCEGTPYCPPRCPRFEAADGRLLHVRPYQPEDARSLETLYDGVDGRDRAVDLPPVAIARPDAWIDRVTSGGWNLVALDGDRVVGHAAVAPADAADPNVLVFVEQEYRDRGVGSELIKQVIAYADGTHRRLTADLSKRNEGAVAICRDGGFDTVETRLSELQMALDLQDSIVEQVQQPPAARN